MANDKLPRVKLANPDDITKRLEELQSVRDASFSRNKEYDIPGKAYWNGYNSNKKPTVKLPDGRVIEVIKTFNASLPIGAEVYVDERGVIDGKSVKEKARYKPDEFTAPRKPRRTAKKKKTIIATPPPPEESIGRTWLVYEEHYEPLPLMTNSGGGAAPIIDSTETLLEQFVASGGISPSFQLLALGLIFDGWQVGFYTYENTETIFTPENNPGLPVGHTGDDYAFFCLISGFLQRFYEGIGFGPEDGVIVGSGSTADLIYAIFTGDWHWARIYMFSGESYRYTTPIIGGIQHFGPNKLSFAYSRTVGVYPAKRFHINVVSWNKYEGASVSLIEEIGDLPGPRTSSRFTIPEDIDEWDYENNFVYEVVPANKPIEHFETGNTMPDDISKFAAYSGNELFLNYIIKCYSVSQADGRLLIYYIPLNLRVNENGSFNYKIGDGTFNQPRHYLIREDPDFPIKAGVNDGGKIYLQAQFVGGENHPVTVDELVAYSIVGGPLTSGQIPMGDPDERDRPGLQVVIGNGAPEAWDPPNENLPFAFTYEPNTGYWEFDPTAFVGIIGDDELVIFDIYYKVFDGSFYSLQGDPANPELGSVLRIYCYGSEYGPNLPPTSEVEPPADPVPIVLPELQPTIDADYVIQYETKIPAGQYIPQEGEEEPFEPFEVIIPLEEEELQSPYFGVGGEVRDVLFYTNPVKEPLVFVNDRFYQYESDISGLTGNIVPELLINEENKFYAIKLVYEPTPTNIQFLDEGEILTVTYEFRYGFNYAPYVGDYEDLGVYPQRTLRRELAKNAFDNDWRKMLNPIIETITEEGDVLVEELDQVDIPARDTNITPMNYDPENNIFTTNFGYEFGVKKPALYNDYSEVSETISGTSLGYTEVVYPYYDNIDPIAEINDPGGWGLRFYLSGDGQRLRPLTRDLANNVLAGQISEIDPENKPGEYFLDNDTNQYYSFNSADATLMQENAKSISVGDAWDIRQLPRRIRMSDHGGRSWRFEIKNSVIDKGYIFTCYNKPPPGVTI